MKNFVYVGPNLPSVGLKQFTLYLKSSPPAILAEFINRKPAIGCLYVPTSSLASVRQNLKQKGSLEQLASQHLTALAKAYQLTQATK